MSTDTSTYESIDTNDLPQNMDDKLIKLIKTDYTYPEVDDENFQEKIYKKREFYYHKIEGRQNINSYNDIKKYRESACGNGPTKLLPQQAFLGNFMNDQTPFKSVLIFHGMGVGKCVIGSELIYVNGSLITMENLYNNMSNGQFDLDNNNGLWSYPKCDLYVNSYDNNCIKLQKVDKMYKEYIDQIIRNVTLENGVELNLTMMHKLLKNGNEWCQSKDLKIGDTIAIPNILYNNYVSSDDISEYILKVMVAFLYLYEKPESTVFNLNLNECDNYLKCQNIIMYGLTIPTFLMCGSLQSIKLFLLIFHNLTNNNITSTSKYFIYQIHHLAKLLKIKSKITRNYNNYSISLDFISHVENDVSYVKITNIYNYRYKNYVYDLEIENIHNYCINGMVTHNTCAAITIAEQFKPLVHKYGTKIYVIVPGPLIKENWKHELLKCTGETYLKKHDIDTVINEDDRTKIKNTALHSAFQYYTFPSYKSFYKNVLGEKITERTVTDDEKVKITFRKTSDGDFERDFTSDRITSLNNAIIIIEEGHNLTNNNYGQALMKIIKNSVNLKVVILTGTPMKNLASDIVELLNFIRPIDDQVVRDKMFTKHTNFEMEFVNGGVEYLKEMTRGYVSYLRGGDPLTMAKRVDMGTIGNQMMFTKVTKSYMLKFQQSVYDTIVVDILDRNSAAVANFAFPFINDNDELAGTYGIEGINSVKNQLKVNGDILNKRIALEILKDDTLKDKNDLMYINDKTNMITGKIFHLDNLKYFSIKFHDCLKRLNDLVFDKLGANTAFIYSNFVVVGVELFQEVLLMNGYLEYEENYNNYKIEPNTRCYYCGKNNVSHNDKNDKNGHAFKPATFITVTGKTTDEAENIIPEEKQKILNEVFSNVDNVDGKYIKFVVGSRVMNEGLSLHNVAEVHILDVYYNLSKVDQTIGRAIRHCKHYDIMSESNPFPEVKVYKYCVSLEKIDPNKLSAEEELYKKAELKYLMVKKVERVLKEVAIDCPLNRNGNIYDEEIKMYENCVPPKEVTSPDQVMCPAICDFMDCNYKCDEKSLNDKYFDKKTQSYRNLSKDELDMTTFNNNLASSEIKYAKDRIKELFRTKYSYLLKDIINYVRNSYNTEKVELFDDFFVFKALDELIPVTENDFNKFADTVYDKYNRPGYILYVSKYYVFQPFDQPQNVPMYYRSNLNKPFQTTLSLVNYLKNIKGIEDSTDLKIIDEITTKKSVYEFDMVYYDSRVEFKYVGTIDKEPSKKKLKDERDLIDVFKLRKKRGKILDKKRGVGIFSMYGSVCYNSFKKEELIKIAKILDIKLNKDESNVRESICGIIRDKLLFLEKYGTIKNNDKFTYVMVPKNHSTFKFPYNLEDRKDYIINGLKKEFGDNVNIIVNENKKKIKDVNVIEYTLEIKNSDKLAEYGKFLKDSGFVLDKGVWGIVID